MRKIANTCNIEGKIYQHKLEIKQVQNKDSANFGKEFISGTIDVATDDENLNIVQVHYTYVSPTLSNGNENKTYSVLKKIIDGCNTVLDSGENATRVRLSPAVAINDFYTTDRQTGEEVLASPKRLEGGFASIVPQVNAKESARSRFTTDMLIKGTKLIEADEERNIPEDYLQIEGYIFNFRNEIFPITYTVRRQDGISYFENLGATSKTPVFIKVWGSIVSKVTKTTKTIESAFGEPEVREYESTFKEYVVTGAGPEPYEIGTDKESDLTIDEIKTALANRDTYLADVKTRAEEYKASKNAGSAAPAAKTGGFNFDSVL